MGARTRTGISISLHRGAALGSATARHALQGLMLMVAALTVTTTARAQQSVAPGRPVYRHQQIVTVDDRMRRLTQFLELSAEQQVKLRVILQQRQALAERLRAGGSISAIDRVRQIQAMDRQTVARIKAELTEDQRRKYDVRSAPPAAPPPAPPAK